MLTTQSTAPFDGERLGDVLLDEAEAGWPSQMSEIGARAGQEIIQRDHRVAFRQKTVAHMRPDEPGGAGNDNSQSPSIVSF